MNEPILLDVPDTERIRGREPIAVRGRRPSSAGQLSGQGCKPGWQENWIDGPPERISEAIVALDLRLYRRAKCGRCHHRGQRVKAQHTAGGGYRVLGSTDVCTSGKLHFMQPLTPRQQQVLEIIRAYALQHGHRPSLGFIARTMGVNVNSWKTHISRTIKALEKRGYKVSGRPPRERVTVTQDGIWLRNRLRRPLTALEAMSLANELHLAAIDLERLQRETSAALPAPPVPSEEQLSPFARSVVS